MDNDSIIIDRDTYNSEWSSEHENILIDWADKAMCYRWMHSKANLKFNRLSRMFTIPVIIISTITGTANFAQNRIPDDYVSLYVMVVGAMNILAGIITTVQQFLKINELNEAHRVSSIAWDKFYRNIKIEIAKKPKERIPVGQMIKFCKEEFDRLMETSPVIQRQVIQRFKNTFKNNSNFSKISKPEICDELITTSEFRFTTSPIKNMIHKLKTVNNISYKVAQVKTKFKKTYNREPSNDEIIETFENNEDYKNIDKNELIEFLNKQQNNIETV